MLDYLYDMCYTHIYNNICVNILVLNLKEVDLLLLHIFLIVLQIAFCALAALGLIAVSVKPSSVYKNKQKEKNNMEGKQVVFVENNSEKENPDGKRGHLEPVGDIYYKKTFYGKYVKRLLDIIVSFGGLVILSPVFLVITVATYLDDPGPIFFTQKRVGENKRYFKLHKFRSMKMSTPHDVPTHMLENPDQYITKIGGFCRRHSLDELPQIWDIFIGNMSIIGPRPALWNQDVLVAERDKYFANNIKPGLTGLAQINGRDELKIEEKAKLDGEYVSNISFLTDIKCFFGSVHVFKEDTTVVEGKTRDIVREKETVTK